MIDLSGHDTCSLLQRELAGPTHGVEEALDLVEDAEVEPVDEDLPPASSMLFNRQYSDGFVDFVTICLEAHSNFAPVSAHELLQHRFIKGQGAIGPIVFLQEMLELQRILNEASDGHDPGGRFGPQAAKSARAVPGVAPSVARNAQLYLDNIAQSVAPFCSFFGPSAPGAQRARSRSDGDAVVRQRWGTQEWEALVVDTARTLGLPKRWVNDALEAQLERLTQLSERDQRERNEVF